MYVHICICYTFESFEIQIIIYVHILYNHTQMSKMLIYITTRQLNRNALFQSGRSFLAKRQNPTYCFHIKKYAIKNTRSIKLI